ncbi:uncharacterized protein LAJ45_08681 [Morchella importuna]|uniref:Myb-like domain-containing protein n=1 Tax=Morchella conica CCBAS932 TaxID=1392247 RepID=A0A3N4L1U9_9PEZI|nr:uncharacterized protein LAJ45_08681 [Morchella importuna]KAH8147203.1 hypothetical protein LAJ45_08681 [Morchella importuna]RPB15688.1 hypothetical protein P167DRAFT_533069 [Morchella conica CCBAS932]
MPVWTDQNRCRLLLTILEINNQKPPPWDEVAQRMGAGYTGAAVKQQYQKLRKEGFPRPGGASGTTRDQVPPTPKRKRAQPLGEKQQPPVDDVEHGSSSDESSRNKRARLKKERISVSPERTIVKTERVDEDGVVRLDDDDLYYC